LIFDQQPLKAAAVHLGAVEGARVRRKDEDLHTRAFLQDCPRRGKAVHSGHAKIQQHDVGTQLPRFRDRLPAVRRLARDFDVALQAQERGDALAEAGIVIGEYDSNRHHASRWTGLVASLYSRGRGASMGLSGG
jgi:hypothetical protein